MRSWVLHVLQLSLWGGAAALGALVVCAAAVGLSVTACMVQPQVEQAVQQVVETVAAPAPEPEKPVADTLGLPDLNDPEHTPRLLCPVAYTRFSTYFRVRNGKQAKQQKEDRPQAALFWFALTRPGAARCSPPRSAPRRCGGCSRRGSRAEPRRCGHPARTHTR